MSLSHFKEFIIHNYFILATSAIFIFLIIYSWMLPIILLSSIVGYYSFDIVDEKIRRFVKYLNERDHDKSIANDLFTFIKSKLFLTANNNGRGSEHALSSLESTSTTLLNCNNVNHCLRSHSSAPVLVTSSAAVSSVRKKKDKDKALLQFDPLLHNNVSAGGDGAGSRSGSIATSSNHLKQAEFVPSKPNTTAAGLSLELSSRSKSPSSLLRINDNETIEITTDDRSVPNSTSSSPSPSKPKLIILNRNETDMKIDQELDKHLAKLCNVIFNHYISTDWAPYETRKQLRQTLRKLLVVFAERVKNTFFDQELLSSGKLDKTKLVNFCKEKIIPLVLYHLEPTRSKHHQFSSDELSASATPSTTTSKIVPRNQLSSTQFKRLHWKVRRLCRQLILEFMPAEQKQCQIWIELCVTILGDGVLWNCILLGRDELPKILEEALEHLLLTVATSTTPTTSNNEGNCDQDSSSSSQNETKINNHSSKSKNHQECDDYSSTKTADLNHVPVPNDNSELKKDSDQQQPSQKQHIIKEINNIPPNTEESICVQVPMLLDSFLDPKYNDPEQPPPIVSKWRPTLNEILIERDLLYSLIQYLRSERALEYLQAVLDESPDGSAYCRRILELEYLPNFCRSKLFLESLGLSRVEVGIEAGSELSLQPSLKSGKGGTLKKTTISSQQHMRSASSGGSGSSSLWKSAIVDGLAIPPSSMPANATGLSSSGASSSSLSIADSAETIFRKRQHVLQPYIDKFYDSTTSFGKHPNNSSPSNEKTKVRRLGIDYKDYEEMNHPDVLTTTFIEPCDILSCSVEIGACWMNRAPWLESIVIGGVQLFHPYLKPRFDEYLDEKLNEVLTGDNFIKFIDLITLTFVESQIGSQTEDPSSSSGFSDGNSVDSSSTTKVHFSNSATTKTTLPPPPASLSSSSTSPLPRFIQLIRNWIILNLFDYSQIVTSIHNNRDELIVFFVDLLDLLVNELTSNPNS